MNHQFPYLIFKLRLSNPRKNNEKFIPGSVWIYHSRMVRHQNKRSANHCIQFLFQSCTFIFSVIRIIYQSILFCHFSVRTPSLPVFCRFPCTARFLPWCLCFSAAYAVIITHFFSYGQPRCFCKVFLTALTAALFYSRRIFFKLSNSHSPFCLSKIRYLPYVSVPGPPSSHQIYMTPASFADVV